MPIETIAGMFEAGIISFNELCSDMAKEGFRLERQRQGGYVFTDGLATVTVRG